MRTRGPEPAAGGKRGGSGSNGARGPAGGGEAGREGEGRGRPLRAGPATHPLPGGPPLPLAVRRAQPPGAPRDAESSAAGDSQAGRHPAPPRGAREAGRGAGPRGHVAGPPHVTPTPRAPGELPGGAAPLASQAVWLRARGPAASVEAGRSGAQPAGSAAEGRGGAWWPRSSRPFVRRGTRDARGAGSCCPPGWLGPGWVSQPPLETRAETRLATALHVVLPGTRGRRGGEPVLLQRRAPACLHTRLESA